MLNGIYNLIVIALAVWALLSGYRKGFLRMVGSVLGVGFGVVATRLAAPECYEAIDFITPGFISGFNRRFVVETFTCGLIFAFVCGIFELLAVPLGKVMKVMPGGVVNSIGGAVFRLFYYMMLLSIVYNLIADLQPDGHLTKTSRYHDGNVVEGVVKLAPAILGFEDAEEVGHFQQLEDAKKIS